MPILLYLNTANSSRHSAPVAPITTICSTLSTRAPSAQAADVPHLVLVGHGQRVGFGADAGDHGDQAARHVADADGEHHDRKRRLPQDRADHQPLEQHAEQGHRGDRAEHGQPEREAQERHRRQAAEGAQHHQLALGEAHGFGGLVDEHEAQRDQPVDASLRDAADHQLNELHRPSQVVSPGYSFAAPHHVQGWPASMSLTGPAASDSGVIPRWNAPVRVEKLGPVTVVTLDRPEVRNAVDCSTARALHEAFVAFDADEEALVAVFHGAHGHFCAGWDLQVGAQMARNSAVAPPMCWAISTSRRSGRIGRDGRLPAAGSDGAVTPAAVQAGDRRRERRGRGRRHGTGAVVRHAGDGRGRVLRRLLPALRRAADRWRHGAAAAPGRHGPRDGPDPHRPQGRGGRGAADGAVQSRRAARARRAKRRWHWRGNWRTSRRRRCGPTG